VVEPIDPTTRLEITMPRPRFANLDPEKRRSLLDVAALEFSAHGYTGASLNRVIDHAGLSKGVFYYYFDDKADLFATVLKRAMEAMLPDETIDLEALDADSYWPTAERFLAEIMSRLRQHTWLAGIAKNFYDPPPAAGVEEVVAEIFGLAWEWIRDFFKRGQAIGLVRTDLPEGLLLAMVFAAAEASDRWMVNNWEDFEPAELDATANEVFATLRRIVEPLGNGGVQ
jgi:AcrR family transcriptional regulator